MAKFHLYKVVPILVDYIDQLTNWYIRMNRKRLKVCVCFAMVVVVVVAVVEK